MITKYITITQLIPDEGMYLTKVSKEKDNEMIFSKSVFLGEGDSADNYREATQEEKDAYDERHATKEVENTILEKR